jgi:hypothetical protein
MKLQAKPGAAIIGKSTALATTEARALKQKESDSNGGEESLVYFCVLCLPCD